MTCKLSGLFSSGEDFDDEDLLGTDWAVPSASGPADVAAAVSSCTLRASSLAHRVPEEICLQQTGETSAALCNGSASRSSTHAAAGQTVALGLRQLSSSSAQPPPSHPPTLNNTHSVLESQQSHTNTQGSLKPCVTQDDFDDWDIDLADLDECDGQMGQLLQPPASAPPVNTVKHFSSLAKLLRPPTCGGIQARPERTLKENSTARQELGSCVENMPPQTPSGLHVGTPAPRPAVVSAPPHSPVVFPGLTASSPLPSPISRTLIRPQQPQKSWATPRPTLQATGLFETVSSPSSPSVRSSTLSSHSIHTPVLTNRLVQLVCASSKLPKKRPRSEQHRPRTRRFPGPAGLLPQQPQGHSLEEIVVCVPHTPAHGVVARLPSQAALKQLAKNKVPNMAVLLKSIIHTHADAKAIFKDPTGEIQGTVHRRLLEDRVEEFKVGAVLLLKQVGVFSPSHRNHYLNVTPNNLLKIYNPNGVSLSSTQLPPLVLEPMLSSPARSTTILREPVSQMQLVFDEEGDMGHVEEKCTEGGEDPQAPAHTRLSSSSGHEKPPGNPSPLDPGWEADDDLDELLGELPEDTYSF
ncbi:homologous recombination OB-fold protein isoform X2 [Channa argus]|uniref:homologous recombination OB-fold protein isoform X2 n=1 Tax=Channa argus TaxID=215402 RepID=UPI00351FEE58